MIEIQDTHIQESESILIDGKSFEKRERIPFIKDLNSCDLLAVPGSGKTTALLAKLYCLAKHLPFKDGSGILILAHTNASVNEIKKQLQYIVPQLFEYPNFVGTIQSFVNKFLVRPFCSDYLKGVPLQIDNSIYYSEIERTLSRKYLKGEILYSIYNNKQVFFNARYKRVGDNIILVDDFSSIEELQIKIPQKWIKEKTNTEKKENIFNFIRQIKKDLLLRGILHYEDCYFVANEYLVTHPNLDKIFQKRFKYVFIDEMQDLENYQIELIDKIFYNEDAPLPIIQRIGDINQAIYNSGKKVKTIADWQVREPIKYLTHSYRLTKETADMVNFFTLDKQMDKNGQSKFNLEGKRELSISLKPHLILFDDASKNELKSKFHELITRYGLEKTQEGKKYGFKIIGWSATWDNKANNDKLRLENIFEGYSKQTTNSKQVFNTLSEYLQLFDNRDKTLKSVRNNILTAFIHILRLENKTCKIVIRGKEKERYYSKTELLKYIKETDEYYNIFLTKIFEWSFRIISYQNYKEVYKDIVKPIVHLGNINF